MVTSLVKHIGLVYGKMSHLEFWDSSLVRHFSKPTITFLYITVSGDYGQPTPQR